MCASAGLPIPEMSSSMAEMATLVTIIMECRSGQNRKRRSRWEKYNVEVRKDLSVRKLQNRWRKSTNRAWIMTFPRRDGHQIWQPQVRDSAMHCTKERVPFEIGAEGLLQHHSRRDGAVIGASGRWNSEARKQQKQQSRDQHGHDGYGQTMSSRGDKT